MQLVFKLEFLQHAGSFKVRGAFTHLLTRNVPTAGVVAASGGNHGLAVAFAAMRTGTPASIFVPGVCAPVKMAQIRACGALLHVVGERYADALAASQQWQRDSGALPIHAFDQPETLLGQATVALEFEQQAPGLDAVLVAVGGGGLIGGMAAWYRDRTALIAVEPEAAPTLAHAMAAGHPVDAPAGGVAADSLAPKQVGALMFPLAQRTCSARCWSATRRSSRRNKRCGACCAWWSNRAARPRSRRWKAARSPRSRVNASACCCAAPTATRCASRPERQYGQYDLGRPSTFSAMKHRISCGLTGASRGIHASRR